MKTKRCIFSKWISISLVKVQSGVLLGAFMVALLLLNDISNLQAQSEISATERVADIDPPASYTRGNFNATLEIIVQNTGDDTLRELKLINHLSSFGLAFVDIVPNGAPYIYSSTATTNPSLSPGYDGVWNDEIFNGSDGILGPGERVVVRLTIELNTYAPGLPEFIKNQSVVKATNESDESVGDVSDTGNNPWGTNPGQWGNTGGKNDPTIIPTRCNSKRAQAMACNNKINLSLGKSCGTELYPSMFLEGEDVEYCDMFYELMFTDKWGNPIIPPIDQRYHKQVIIVKVIDAIFGNSCWSEVYIEDKFGPTIVCESDTIFCNELDSLPPPEFYDNCDPNPVMYFTGQDVDRFNCDPLYMKRVTRYYRAVDYNGATSTCAQVIMLKRIPLDSVVYPHNFNRSPYILACNGDYPKDVDGHPSTDTTGVPTVNDLPIYPSSPFCNLSADYEDTEILLSDCKKKVIRIWTVVDWNCVSPKIVTYAQTIMIVDDEGPVVECPSDIIETTKGSYRCEGEVWLPSIQVYDSCSHDSVYVDIEFPGGKLVNSNGGRVILPYGDHVVTYIAYDQCNNTTECQINVRIEDYTPPVTVCDGHTTISINQTGEAELLAEVLDDGTFDDCQLDRLAVRRMDMGAPCDFPDTLFQPYVRFCCEDVGDTLMVIFRAWDIAGNYNDCMVEVVVQDKLPPIIACPNDVTVYCDDYIDTSNLIIYGFATSTDNCGVVISEEDEFDISACMTGIITRTFIATDNGGRADTCQQRITILDNNPFDSTDIQWPIAYEVNGCGNSLHPDSLPALYGRPIVQDDACSLVGITFEDDIFSFIPGSDACFKIIRKWQIIDWCNFKYENGGVTYTKWIHEQVIKVNNSIDPVFTGDCAPKSICTYDAACQNGYIELTMGATDDCTPDSLLKWEYHIDLFNDNVYDTIVFGIGDFMDASGDYPIGKHTILWQFEDICGNKVTCFQDFEIVNCKPPTPICRNGLIVELMPIDTNNDGQPDVGMVEVWASDIDSKSFHPCGTDIILSFSSDTMDNFRTYTCDSLGKRTVQLWVTNQGSGEQDYCETFVEIQDNNGVCADSITTGTITGRLLTAADNPISNAKVKIDRISADVAISDNSGVYDIQNVPIGANYTLSASRNLDPLEGVSTRDLVAVQNHLLGKTNIISPYRMLAADVNNSGHISTVDISLIRKLILGKIPEFPKADSWIFVPSAFSFSDPDNPFLDPVPTALDINMSGDLTGMDFIGLKMGDINGDATGNGYTMPQIRSGSIKFDIGDQILNPNEITWVPVYVEDEIQTLGWQLSLKYNSSKMQVIGLREGVMQLDDRNFAIDKSRGIVNMSWNSMGVVSISTDKPMFYLGLIAKAQCTLSDELALNYEGLRDEWYPSNQDIFGIRLNFTNKIYNSQIFVGQNTPNPFNSTTHISFSLPQDQWVVFEILDYTGKIVYKTQANYDKGQHRLRIERSDIQGGSGVYYYRFQIGQFTQTYKMVIMN